MQRTVTSARAPEARRGAPMLVTPIPKAGGCQFPRGDCFLIGDGSGRAVGRTAGGWGAAGLLAGGRGLRLGAADARLGAGSSGITSGTGVDSLGGTEADGVGLGAGLAIAPGSTEIGGAEGDGNVISMSPKASAGEVGVGDASGWAAPTATPDPTAPATPRTRPPARHAPTAIARVRGVSCMTRPRSHPRSSGSL